MCRTDDQNKGNFDELWGIELGLSGCHDRCLYALGCTGVRLPPPSPNSSPLGRNTHRASARAGFEYAVEGKASRCKLFKGPILSTLPVGGARCYKKASKTELGPHKKRL